MEPEYLYCNYPEISEIWKIVVPTQEMYEFFRSAETNSETGGMDGLARLIHDKSHHPHRNGLAYYFLLRAKVGEQDMDWYFLCWTGRRFNPVAGIPVVLKTQGHVGLTPVPVLTSGFVLDPTASEADKQGNRLIERI